jgi:WD40 repeat protein
MISTPSSKRQRTKLGPTASTGPIRNERFGKFSRCMKVMKRFRQILIVCGAGLLPLENGHSAEPPDIVWEGEWSDWTGGSVFGRSIALFPDGRRMVTLGHGGIVRFWDVVEGRLVREVLDENSQRMEELTPLGLSISPDGKRIATTWEVVFSPRSIAGELQIRDENWNHIRTVRLDRVSTSRSPAFSSDGSVVAVEGIREGHEGSVPSQHLIRVEDGSLFKTVPGRGVALFSKNGSWLVVGGQRTPTQLGFPSTVWKWPEATLQWSRHYGARGSGVSEIAISDDSSLLALIANLENRVRLIRLEDGSLVHTFVGSQERDPESEVFLHPYRAVAFTPDNRMLAILTVHAGPPPRRVTIAFWDLENMTEYRSFESSGWTPTFLLFSPDAQLFFYHKTQGIFAVARAPAARPRLKLSRDHENLFFSWPALVEGYTLEQTGEIGSTAWEPVNRSPVTIDNEWVLTVEPEPGARFFRLRQP